MPQDLQGPGRGKPPCSSYAATAIVGLLLLLAGLLSLALQLAAAALTLPCLLCSSGRQLFHSVQSRIFRGVVALVCVLLNPFWRTETHWIGSVAGPPNIVPGSVIFCNHRSNADPFLLSWLLLLSCVEARFIYKSSLAKVPILGICASLAGDLPVRFGDKQQILQMLAQSKELLGRGVHLVVFPEGTRSPSGILQDFKPSFFEVCAELGCPAVPVCLLGSERAWPHGGLRMGCAKIRMAIGEPVLPGQGGASALSAAIAERMQDMAREAVERGEGVDTSDDPFLTKEPYPYWTPPKDIEAMQPEEQMRLLRQGGTHERGAHLF